MNADQGNRPQEHQEDLVIQGAALDRPDGGVDIGEIARLVQAREVQRTAPAVRRLRARAGSRAAA